MNPFQLKSAGDNFTYGNRSLTTEIQGRWTGMDYHGNSNGKTPLRQSIYPAGCKHQLAAEAYRNAWVGFKRAPPHSSRGGATPCAPMLCGSHLEDHFETTNILIPSPAVAANCSVKSFSLSLPLVKELSQPLQGNFPKVSADWICFPSLHHSCHFLSLPY